MSLGRIASQTAPVIRWSKREGHLASLEATEHVFCARSEKTPCPPESDIARLTTQSATRTQYLETQRVQLLAL